MKFSEIINSGRDEFKKAKVEANKYVDDGTSGDIMNRLNDFLAGGAERGASSTKMDAGFGDVMRGSGIFYTCPRKSALAIQEWLEAKKVAKKRPSFPIPSKKTKGSSIGSRMRANFDVGTALHAWYQNNYLAHTQLLWGQWDCHDCNTTHWGLAPEGHLRHELEYVEPDLCLKHPTDERYDIHGHCDGIVRVPATDEFGHDDPDGTPTWFGLEIKTMKDDYFDDLVTPFVEHVYQLHFYLGLLNNYIDRLKETYPDMDVPPHLTKGKVFVIRKGFPNWKEFPIDFDPKMFEEQKQQAWAVKEFYLKANNPKTEDATLEKLAAKILKKYPRKSICPSKSSKRGGRCGYKKECFGCDE